MSFFRATASATQSISASTETAMNFGTEVSDPDGAFASNVFTVPSGWNNRIGMLEAGFRASANIADLELRIQKQTGGSGSFVTIAANSTSNAVALTVSSGPLLFSTGDVYRVAFFGSAATKANDVRNFFAGFVTPAAVTKLGIFRASTSAGQTIASGSVLPFPLEVTDYDSHSAFASGVMTVPSAFNGGFVVLTAGVNTGGLTAQIYLERSTDGGSSWSFVAMVGNELASDGLSLASGAIAAVTGHKFRLSGFISTGVMIAEPDPRTFFSGLLFKY